MASARTLQPQDQVGDIDDMKWSRDGSRIYFTYGAISQNVVLIRNFR